MKRQRDDGADENEDREEDETAKQQRTDALNLQANTTPPSTGNAPPTSIPSDAGAFLHLPFRDGRNQIRLLQMLPSGNADEKRLRYSIGTYDFDQVKSFIAISYTWGDSKDERPILIDGRECHVRPNCRYVLKHIYRQWCLGQLGDYLWIDSVCINQNDNPEKSLQVAFMGEIYAAAAEVIVCVGPHADDSEFFVEKAREVAGYAHDCDHRESFMCEECRAPWEKWVRSLGLECLTRLCVACETFGSRTYWTRIWIIQEVAKARSLRILCGADIFPWKAVRNLEDFLAIEMDEIESLFETYKRLPSCEHNSMHDVFVTRKESILVEDVFSRFSQSTCSVPRDRLYGLLGLVEWPESMEPITPDYDASIFQVAVLVLPYFPLERIPEMLEAFRITSEDKDVRRLVEERRQEEYVDAVNSTTDAVGAFRPLSLDEETGESIPSLCAYLELDEWCNMTAALAKERSDYVESEPSVSEESSEEQSDQASDSEKSRDSSASMEPFKSSVPLELRPQPVMICSEIVGYVCNAAREGDILVRISSSNRILLILRQTQDGNFDVIGQGMLLREYVFGCDPDVYDDSENVALFTAQVEVKLAAEDIVLLFAMGFDDVDEDYDLEDCWNQALTQVTGASVGAARITEKMEMLAKDAVLRGDKGVPGRDAAVMNHLIEVRKEFPPQYCGWVEGLSEETEGIAF